jgi:plastocyanin
MKHQPAILYVLIFSLVIIGCTTSIDIEAKDIIPQDLEQEKVVEDIKEQIIQSQGYTVSMLGSSGFNKDIMRIQSGDQIIFVNNDPREKDMVLTFQKNGTQTFFNSDITSPRASYTHTFNDEGVFDYWSLGYGIRASIIVS